jgi:hypothetical protein
MAQRKQPQQNLPVDWATFQLSTQKDKTRQAKERERKKTAELNAEKIYTQSRSFK